MNSLLKRALERAAVSAGLPRIGRMLRRHDTLILAYHDVISPRERPSGDVSLHLPLDSFRRQLDLLSATHEVIALPSVFEAAVGSRPRAVITFDDAYRGALEHGLPELVSRELPATVFVSPGLLGAQPWWDLLADPQSGAVQPALRQRALEEHAGDGEVILREHGPPHSGIATAIASESEVVAASRQPRMTLGAHGWSHSNLAALDERTLERELREPLTWLRSRSPATIPWLSYPYGICSPTVERAASEAGYAGALRVEGGWLNAGATNRFALPRFNVPAGLSLDGFRLRLAGIAAQ